MTKAQVMAQRKYLHGLARRNNLNDDGGPSVDIPIYVQLDTDFVFDEKTHIIFWDDEAEGFYALKPNSMGQYGYDGISPVVAPSTIEFVGYGNIFFIGARVDPNCVRNFMDDMIAKGLSTQSVKSSVEIELMKSLDANNYVDKPHDKTKGMGYGIEAPGDKESTVYIKPTPII